MIKKCSYLFAFIIFLSACSEIHNNTDEKIHISITYVKNPLWEIKDIELFLNKRNSIYKKFNINNPDDSRKNLKYTIINNCIVFIVEANVVDKMEWIPKIKSKVGNKMVLDACMKKDEIKIGMENVFYIASICLDPFPKDSLEIGLAFCE